MSLPSRLYLLDIPTLLTVVLMLVCSHKYRFLLSLERLLWPGRNLSRVATLIRIAVTFSPSSRRYRGTWPPCWEVEFGVTCVVRGGTSCWAITITAIHPVP